MNGAPTMSSIFSHFGSDQEGLNLYEAVVQRSPIGILILDPDGTILSVNTAWTDMTEYSAAETVGMRLTEFIHPHWVEIVRRALQPKPPTANHDTMQVGCRVKSGNTLEIELSICTVRNGRAGIMSYVAYTGLDMIKQRAEIEKQKVRVEQLSRQLEAHATESQPAFCWSTFLNTHWQALLTTGGACLTFLVVIGVQFTTMQERVQRQEQVIDKLQVTIEKLVSEHDTDHPKQPKSK